MDHIKILKRALQITWKYRALWLIGLLLVLAGGGVAGGFPSGPPGGNGGGGGGGNGGSQPGGPGGEWHLGDTWPEVWHKIAPIVLAIGAIILALFVLFFLIGIVAVILRYVTRTSLIGLVDQYEETSEELGFWSGLRLGWSRSAFRLFLISLMLKLPIALLMMLMIGPLIGLAIPSFINGSGAMIALGVVLVLLIIPAIMLGVGLRIVVAPVIEVTYRACVIQKLGAWEAVKSAFGLIRRNLGPTALQWLLLVGLGIAWRIALVPVNLLLFVLGILAGGLPALLLGGLTALAAGWPWGVGLGALVFVPVFLVLVALPNVALNTLATVYQSTTWTLAYRELRVIDSGVQEAESTDADDLEPQEH